MWHGQYPNAEMESTGTEPESDLEGFDMDSDKVMKEVERIYTMNEVGLKLAAKSITEKLIRVNTPKQKITILIMGHHYTAKEKFLEQYFDDTRQGGYISRMDLNKLNKILITQGTRRKWLNGEVVLDHCPHLAQLKNVPGLKDNLVTEVALRNAKSLVSFILAPDSLPEREDEVVDWVDKNNNPINRSQSRASAGGVAGLSQAVGSLADAADLIFVFFDPTGVIPPETTLSPLKSHWERNHSKIHLLLSKTEEDKCDDTEREDTFTLIARELWKMEEVRELGYLPPVYWPDLSNRMKGDQQLWLVIDNATQRSVERALNQLEGDANMILEHLMLQQEQNERSKSEQRNPTLWYVWLVVFVALLMATWVSEGNEVMCKWKESDDWQQACKDVAASKAVTTTLGIVLISLIMLILSREKPGEPLSPLQENLLSRRIQFANEALFRKKQLTEMIKGTSRPPTSMY